MPAYATVSEFRTSSKLTSGGLDTQIQMCLDAASEAIDGFCNRKDGFIATAPLTRIFASTGTDVVSCDDCIAVSLVEECSNGAWVALASGNWVAAGMRSSLIMTRPSRPS